MRIAGFPVRRLALRVGELDVHLFSVRRLEDYVDCDALLRDEASPEPPYWAHLWPGSVALARLLAGEIDCRGRTMLEVGCGLGLCGIVAALRGAHTSMFDRDAAGIEFARANARLNGCEVEVFQADLLEPLHSGCFDYVCAADVTYEPRLQHALAALAAAVLRPGGSLLAAESVRTFDRGLQDACQAHGLSFAQRDLHEIDDGRRVSVRLTHAVKPPGTSAKRETV